MFVRGGLRCNGKGALVRGGLLENDEEEEDGGNRAGNAGLEEIDPGLEVEVVVVMSRGGETDMLDSVDVVLVLGALVAVDVVGACDEELVLEELGKTKRSAILSASSLPSLPCSDC